MPDIQIGLAGKVLVMVVGPVAVGKSSLMNEVVRKDRRFARVSGFTSRAARTNDEPGLYRYVSDTAARRLLDSSDLVQYAVHPTTGAVYGTQLQDYPGRYNLLDTLSTVADELRHLPFERVVTLSLTTDPDTWQTWLLQRYPKASDERTKRLREAISSIEWSLNQTMDHHWLVNTPAQLPHAAERLIRLATGDMASLDTPREAPALLERARTLLSYDQKEG